MEAGRERRQGEYPSCFEGTVLTYREEENACAAKSALVHPLTGKARERESREDVVLQEPPIYVK